MQTYRPPSNQQQIQQHITQPPPDQQQHTQQQQQQQYPGDIGHQFGIQQQGGKGHQLGINYVMQTGLATMTPNHGMSPGMESLGMQQGMDFLDMQQGNYPSMPNNHNMLSGMLALGMQQGNFPNMQSLGMPQGNFSHTTPNQNLGYQPFPQAQQPYLQQGMQYNNYPQNQNPSQLGFPTQNQTDLPLSEMGRSMAQNLVTGAPVNEAHMSFVSNLLQYGSTCTTTTSTPAPSTTNGIMTARLAQGKLHNLLGWSGCNNPQTAWAINNQAWVDFGKCTTGTTRQEFIKSYFCTPLQTRFGRDIDFTKHQVFIKMMADLDFEPQLEAESFKVSHRISPLCFFDLQRGALLNSMYFHKLNLQATVNTTSDIEETKMGAPIILLSPKELLTVLNRMIICLGFFFGNFYMLRSQIQQIYTTLDQLQHKYEYGPVFQNELCKTICNGISKGCVRYFAQRKSGYDIQQNNFATMDLSSTITAIKLNITNNEINFPIFLSTIPKPPPQYQQQLQNPPIINNNNKRQQEQDLKQRTRSKQDAKPTFATTIPKFWTDIVNKYTTAKIRIPKTNDVRTQLKFDTNAAFAQALGITENDCITYCIKRECYHTNCKQTHLPNITPKENILIPTYAELLKDAQSKK